MYKLNWLITALLAVSAFAAGRTVEKSIAPPAGYHRVALPSGAFASALRQIELSDRRELLAGDGKTLLCEDEKVAVTTAAPFDNKNDTGLDGIVRLWGDYLWKSHSPATISFPLDNGQRAMWKDWRDGLRPREVGGRYVFTQVTTPNGSRDNFDQYLAFVAEAMGAIALRRESNIVLEDSLSAGDLIVALGKKNESRVGIILDACKGPRGDKLYLVGTCGTPSTYLYITRPYSPIQGNNEWFTLEGAEYAIGEGARADLRRVTLK
jgi:hypothetical protein